MGILRGQIQQQVCSKLIYLDRCVQLMAQLMAYFYLLLQALSLREATVDSMRYMTRHLLTRSEMNVSTMPIRMAITSLLQVSAS